MRTATTAQIATSGGMLTPNVFVPGEARLISQSGRSPENDRLGLHLERARARSCPWRGSRSAAGSGSGGRSSPRAHREPCADDADREASRERDAQLVLEHAHDERARDDEARDREVEPAHQDQQRLAGRASPASDASTRISLTLFQFQKPEVDRPVGEDGESATTCTTGKRACRPTSLRQDGHGVRACSALRPATRAHAGRLRAVGEAEQGPRRTTSMPPYITCSQLGSTCRVISSVPSR